MIRTSRTVETLDGKTLELGGCGQIWGIRLQIGVVDEDTGQVPTWNRGEVFHCTRAPLEKCGLLPQAEYRDGTKGEPKTENVEDLLRRLLEQLGVQFEQ